MKTPNFDNYLFFVNFVALIAAVFLFLQSPQYYIYIFIFLISAYILESILIINKSLITEQWWNLAIFPCITVIALIASLSVLSNKSLLQIIAVSSAWLVAVFWRKAYRFFCEPKKYKLGSLEYLADYGNIYVILLLAIGFFGFKNYLETPFWQLIVSFAPIMALIFYNYFWANKLSFKIFWPYLLVGVLILSQLAWALTLLPFTFTNLAILFTVLFYATLHLQKLHLQAKLTNEKIRHYLAFITITFIIIFLSARWL